MFMQKGAEAKRLQRSFALWNWKLTTFMGCSMFYGEPLKRVIGYVTLDPVDALRGYILKSGWKQVTEIVFQPWGNGIHCSDSGWKCDTNCELLGRE